MAHTGQSNDGGGQQTKQERPARRDRNTPNIERDRVREEVRRGLFDRDEQVTIGHFEISKRLGAGAMGIVYEAVDTQLDRTVALKLLQPDMASTDPEQFQARMLREAKAMARLSHPNVVGVHEVGTHDDQVYIAMEFVRGTTLRQWLDQRRSWREVLDVMLPAGRGLAAAHAQGLLHRDFKPDNVLLEGGVAPKIVDFGLARDIDMASEESAETDLSSLRARLTVTGAVLGTPVYMAPEQLRGEHADARSDQFAFCVTLFEALYGKRPFEGDDFEDLQRAQSSVPLPSAAGSVPAWLRKVVLRGLAFDPNDRYPSMDALLADLDRRPRRNGVVLAIGVPIALLVFGGAAAVILLVMNNLSGDEGPSTSGKPPSTNTTSSTTTSPDAPPHAPAPQSGRSSALSDAERQAMEQVLHKARELRDQGRYRECLAVAEKAPATERTIGARLSCAASIQDWDAYERACIDARREFPDTFDNEVCGPQRIQLYRLMAQQNFAECLRVAKSLPPTMTNLGYQLSCAGGARDWEAYRQACEVVNERYPTHQSAAACTTLLMRMGITNP